MEAFSFTAAIHRVKLPDYQVDAMIEHCLKTWERTSSTRERATQFMARRAQDPAFHQEARQTALEATAVSSLLLTLDQDVDVLAAIKQLPSRRQDLELAAVRAEIASRGVQLNRQLHRLTELHRAEIQRRLEAYLSH